MAAAGSWAAGPGAVPLPPPDIRDGIVVTAERPSDEVTRRRVEAALRAAPYLFADHVTVSVEDGVVRLSGVTSDLQDLLEMQRMARRIPGARKVINEIEFMPLGSDAD